MAPVSSAASRPVSTPKAESKPAPKPAAAPSAEKASAKPSSPPASQPADKFEKSKASGSQPANHVTEKSTKNFSSSAQNDIQRLSESRKASVATNKDGSVTRSQSSQSGNTTRTQELTTNKGALGDSKLKYETTSKTGNQEVKNSYNSQTDVLGRTQSTRSREVTVDKGDTSTTRSRTEATDRFGDKKITKTEGQTQTDGNKSKTQTSSVTTDSHGNKAVSQETKTTETNGDTTVTRTSKQSSGTERTTKSTSGFANGKLTAGEQVDVKNNKFSSEKSVTQERQLRPSSKDEGFTQAQKDDKLTNAQKVGDIAGAAGLKKEVVSGGVSPDKMKENDLTSDPNSFVGTRHGVAGKQSVTVGADGVDASFNREAKAGVYAEKKGSVKGEMGEASYDAKSKVEARAAVDAKGKVNLNGVDASVNAKAGVSAEASINGKAQTKLGTVAGVDVNASVEGTAKASAEASVEATGKVKATRNPPTAVAEGTVGASAVAKVEGEVKASAGPFAVKASGYASAGAEAKASGVIGYEDGKLKIGGSVGAALGVGAGGAVNVEVDVKQIGEMAKNTAVNAADVNNDGKLGVDDAKAAVSAVADTAKNVVEETKNKVKDFFGF
jgi:hypothetical protein